MTPSWDNLIEMNRATAGRPIQAVVHFAGNAALGWTSQRLWFGPPDRWRVEDSDGVVQRVQNDDFEYRRVDSELHRYRVRDGAPLHRPIYPPLEPPSEMLVAHRRWPAPASARTSTASSPVDSEPVDAGVERFGLAPLAGQFRGETTPPPMYEPAGTVEPVTVRGRAGWTIPCVMPTVAQHPVAVTLTFDAETGVVIGRNAGQRYRTVEMSDVVLDEQIDASVFEWDGQYVD